MASASDWLTALPDGTPATLDMPNRHALLLQDVEVALTDSLPITVFRLIVLPPYFYILSMLPTK